MMTVTTQNPLINNFPYFKDEQYLLKKGDIRKECTRKLGEISHCKGQFPISHYKSQTSGEALIVAKLQYIKEAYNMRQTTLGKIEFSLSQSSLPSRTPRILAQRSFHGGAMF